MRSELVHTSGPADAAAVLAELVAFCRDEGAPCFTGWPEDLLRDYLAFHSENGSLAFVRAPGVGRPIIGLAIGWQCHRDELEQHWYPWNPAGDTFLFSQLVCTRPGALRSLVRNFQTRVPHWSQLRLVARRRKRGRIVTYPARFIERLSRWM